MLQFSVCSFFLFCSIFQLSHLFLNPIHQPILIEQFPLCFLTYYLRCDGCIAVLSADVSSGERQLIRLQQEVAELRSAVDVKLKEMKEKVRDGDTRTDKALWHAKPMIFTHLINSIISCFRISKCHWNTVTPTPKSLIINSWNCLLRIVMTEWHR